LITWFESKSSSTSEPAYRTALIAFASCSRTNATVRGAPTCRPRSGAPGDPRSTAWSRRSRPVARRTSARRSRTCTYRPMRERVVGGLVKFGRTADFHLRRSRASAARSLASMRISASVRGRRLRIRCADCALTEFTFIHPILQRADGTLASITM
jgi:hypothetical protein